MIHQRFNFTEMCYIRHQSSNQELQLTRCLMQNLSVKAIIRCKPCYSLIPETWVQSYVDSWKCLPLKPTADSEIFLKWCCSNSSTSWVRSVCYQFNVCDQISNISHSQYNDVISTKLYIPSFHRAFEQPQQQIYIFLNFHFISYSSLSICTRTVIMLQVVMCASLVKFVKSLGSISCATLSL